MIDEELVHKVILFFLLAFMDEGVAMQASRRAVAQLKLQLARAGSAASSPDCKVLSPAVVVKTLNQVYLQMKRGVPRNRAQETPIKIFTDDSSLARVEAWRKFQREGSESELVAVLLGRVLGYDNEALAEGLGTSLGTANYRVGKGIRALGRVVRSREGRTDDHG